jgi:hypothetical protein
MPLHDRLDLARVLLARAVDDETLVRKLCSDADVADAIVGFHAQQAAEKLDQGRTGCSRRNVREEPRAELPHRPG